MILRRTLRPALLALAVLAAQASIAGSAAAEPRQIGALHFDAPEGWRAKSVTSGLVLEKQFPADAENKKGAAMIHVLGPFAEPQAAFDRNFETTVGMIEGFAEEDPLLKAAGTTSNGHRIRSDYRCCASIGNVSAGLRTVGIASPRNQAFFSLIDFQLRDERQDEVEAAFASMVRSVRLEPADKPFALVPASGDGGLDGVFTHLDTGVMPNAFGGTDFYSDSKITVFDPSGLFSTELPEAGDIQAHCRATPTDCGLYKVSGGGFFGGARQIEMREVADEFGTLEAETKPLEQSSGGLTIDGTVHARVPPPPAGTPFEGTWRYFYASSGMMAASSGSIAVERILTLSRNGRFERSGFTGASATGDAGGGTSGVTVSNQRPAASGRYRVDGYAIELTGDDGRTERLSLFAPDEGSDDLLVIGGNNYLKAEDEKAPSGGSSSSSTSSTPKRPRS